MKEKKYLSPKQVADLLDLPIVTISRWEHQGKIPYKIINHKRCFKKKEILAWAKAHDFMIKSCDNQKLDKSQAILGKAIQRGGIYYDVEGNDIYGIFQNSLNLLPFLTPENKKILLDELLNREELASTGIGKGIAIPHTRQRLDLGLQETYVSVIFLKNAIELNAVDGQPVYVLFMLFTKNIKEHLKILSKLSYILHDNDIWNILHNKNKDNNLLAQIIRIENESQEQS